MGDKDGRGLGKNLQGNPQCLAAIIPEKHDWKGIGFVEQPQDRPARLPYQGLELDEEDNDYDDSISDEEEYYYEDSISNEEEYHYADSISDDEHYHYADSISDEEHYHKCPLDREKYKCETIHSMGEGHQLAVLKKLHRDVRSNALLFSHVKAQEASCTRFQVKSWGEPVENTRDSGCKGIARFCCCKLCRRADGQVSIWSEGKCCSLCPCKRTTK